MCVCQTQTRKLSFVSGSKFSLTLSGSAPVAVKDEEFNLTCSVKYAENFKGVVLFRHYSKPANFDYYFHQLTKSRCTSSSSITICGRGTSNPFSYEKLYIMMFKSPSSEDEGKWWCVVLDAYVLSNAYTIKLQRECLCLFIDTSSLLDDFFFFLPSLRPSFISFKRWFIYFYLILYMFSYCFSDE